MIFVWCGLTMEAEITETGLKIGMDGHDVTQIAFKVDPELKELLTKKIQDEYNNRIDGSNFGHRLKSE